MPKWKQNGWTNSKKGGVAKKSLWIALDAAISRHRRVEFSWVKAHCGILNDEIADALATRRVKGSSYCPTNRFDVLPADTEPEDDRRVQYDEPVITQTDDLDEDEHLPTFSSPAICYGLEADDPQDIQAQRLIVSHETC
jgi:hypothetical protein